MKDEAAQTGFQLETAGSLHLHMLNAETVESIDSCQTV